MSLASANLPCSAAASDPITAKVNQLSLTLEESEVRTGDEVSPEGIWPGSVLMLLPFCAWQEVWQQRGLYIPHTTSKPPS